MIGFCYDWIQLCGSFGNDERWTCVSESECSLVLGLVDAVPNATDLARLESALYEGDGSLSYFYDPSVRPQPFESLNLTIDFYALGVTGVVRLAIPLCSTEMEALPL